MFDGKAMKSARRAKRITGQELARRVAVTNVTISRVENERQAPSRDLAERIAQELGVEAASLYRDQERGQGPMTSDLPSEEQGVLVAFRRLDRLGRAKAWAFLTGLASGACEGSEAATESSRAKTAAHHPGEP